MSTLRGLGTLPRRFAILATSSALVIAACADTQSGGEGPRAPRSLQFGDSAAASAPKIYPAPAHLAGRAVLFDDHVAGGDGFVDPDSVAREGSQALIEAGFVIVRDAMRPHDFDVHFTLERGQKRDAPPFYIMRVEYDGATIDQIRLVDGTPRNAAVNLVNQLGMSPRMQALAERKGWATAVAQAPAPAQPPSAPATLSTTTPAPAVGGDRFVSGAPQPTAFALIIGIEHYKTLPSPSGAKADAERFAQMARQSLGVPAAHIRVALDDEATKGTIERHLEWLKASVPSGGRIYFYLSGHGAPDAASGSSHIVPVDGDPQYLAQTGLRVSDVLGRLSQSKAKDVLAVVDSCFSGAGGRSVLPPGARALVRMKTEPVTGRLALLSPASGAEISGPSTGGASGLFTQYVLEALGTGAADGDGDGQVSLQELADFVRPRVVREARKDNRDQTPTLVVSQQLGAPSSFVVAWGLPPR